MKHLLYIVLALFCGLSGNLSAQVGRSGYILYMLGQNGIYYYNPILTGQLDTLTMGNYTDMDVEEFAPIKTSYLAVVNDSLFLASTGYPNPFRDTIPNVYGQKVCRCDSFILVGSRTAPYLRVFKGIYGQLSPAFTLDTLKAKQTPSDLACHNGIFYAAMGNQIIGIDPILADTTGSVQIPDYFWGSGFPAWLIPMDSNLYVDIEYGTAMVRFTLLKMDYHTFVLDSVLHREGYGNWAPPVGMPYDERIRMLEFPSYYSIPDDSLYISSTNPFPNLIQISYGYVDYYCFDHMAMKFYRFQGILPTDSIQMTGESIRKGCGKFDVGVGIPEAPFSTNTWAVYPNPATDRIHIEGGLPVTAVMVCDISGRVIMRQDYPGTESGVRLDLSRLRSGIYLLVVGNKDLSEVFRIIKH